jgi:hypothetical protein
MDIGAEMKAHFGKCSSTLVLRQQSLSGRNGFFCAFEIVLGPRLLFFYNESGNGIGAQHLSLRGPNRSSPCCTGRLKIDRRLTHGGKLESTIEKCGPQKRRRASS